MQPLSIISTIIIVYSLQIIPKYGTTAVRLLLPNTDHKKGYNAVPIKTKAKAGEEPSLRAQHVAVRER